MNLLIILAVGLSIIFFENRPKNITTVIEDSLICRPANEGWCMGWKE